MISTVRFYKTAVQRPKVGTTGYDSQDEVNRKISEIQTELMSFLVNFYETNNQVKDLLAPFVTSGSDTLTNGILAKDADYVRLVSIDIDGYPCYPTRVNAVPLLKKNTIRRPSIANNLYYYAFKDDEIQIYPEEVTNANYEYIRQPADALITLTPVSQANIVYQDPTSTADFEWPEEAFNLLLYMYWEKLGIEMKEGILVEYGKLGIAQSLPQTNPKP